MGKKGKRRQNKKKNQDNYDQETYEIQEDALSKCPHIKKSVKLGVLQNHIPHLKLGKCCLCNSSETENNGICICLRCAKQGCDRYSDKRHGLNHYGQFPSHNITLHLQSMKVWCYSCDMEIPVNPDSDLHECVKHLVKALKLTNVDKYTTTSITSFQLEAEENMSSTSSKTQKIKNLSQTELLHVGMEFVNQSVYSQTIVGPEVKKMSVEVTNPPGPLVTSLNKLLVQFRSNMASGPLNPKFLFSEICKKAPRFKGFQQQDSQELIRYLLDSVKADQLKRVKLSVLKHFEVTEEVGVKSLSQESKGKLKEYIHLVTAPSIDNVFAGKLDSIVVCHQCHEESRVTESFLDLSLSLQEPKQSNKPYVNKISQSEDDEHIPPSKHKQKAAKQAKRKKGRQKGKIRINHRYSDENVDDGEVNLLKTHDKIPPDEVNNSLVLGPLKSCNTDIDQSHENIHKSRSDHGNSANQRNQSKIIKDIQENEDSSTINANKDSSAKVVYETKKDASLPMDYIKTPIKLGEDFVNGSNEQNVSKEFLGNSSLDEESLKDIGNTIEGRRCESLCKTGGTVRNPESANVENCVSTEDESPNVFVSKELYVASIREEVHTHTLAANDDEDPSLRSSVDPNSYQVESLSNNFENGLNLSEEKMYEFYSNTSYSDDGDKRTKDIIFTPRNVVDVKPRNIPQNILTSNGEQEVFRNDTFMDNTNLPNVSTIGNPYTPYQGESSIQSCLAQFCSPEILQGKNKFLCEACSRKSEESSSDESSRGAKATKKVYTNATKQLLISDPPPVLTLHLKRFQQVGHGLRKISKHVEFPFDLDLGPFCCTGTNTVHDSSHAVLYSLFGLVEHTGGLNSGHYTACIKLKHSPTYQIETKTIKDLGSLLQNIWKNDNLTECTHQRPGDGQWYYVSDSRVVLVNEEKVRRSQAYLLFYERLPLKEASY